MVERRCDVKTITLQRRYDVLCLLGCHMNNQTVMKNIFSLCKRLFNQPAHIFNADESGVDLNSKAGKVIIHTKLKHAYSEQKTFRNHIPTLVCCSALGLTLSPMIIFEKSWPSGPYA